MILLGILIMLAGIYFYRAFSMMKNTPMVADHEKIITLTDKNFQHQTKDRLVLVDFWAAWCAPCRMMAPILNDLAGELSGNTHIGKVNIEEHQSLANKFNVRSIPTLVLFKNGKEIKRFVGVKSKDYLASQLKNV